jgi:hypothetical protein
VVYGYTALFENILKDSLWLGGIHIDLSFWKWFSHI